MAPFGPMFQIHSSPMQVSGMVIESVWISNTGTGLSMVQFFLSVRISLRSIKARASFMSTAFLM